MDFDTATFYGSVAISKVRDMDKLNTAVKQFKMALASQNETVAERALTLACKNEALAFAA